MMRLLAFGLASLLLLQTFSFAAREILKVGELIEHAQLHSEEYGDSFLTFLSKHYGDLRQEHSKDHEEHEDLPFHHGSIHLHIAFMNDTGNTLPVPGLFNEDKNLQAIYQEHATRCVPNPVFQPPISPFS